MSAKTVVVVTIRSGEADELVAAPGAQPARRRPVSTVRARSEILILSLINGRGMLASRSEVGGSGRRGGRHGLQRQAGWAQPEHLEPVVIDPEAGLP